MKIKQAGYKCLFLVFLGLAFCSLSFAQKQKPRPTPEEKFSFEEFGPVVREYLSYLDDEQIVTDDRASRREITRDYYLRNTNRISALRQTILRIVRETGNDYVPELEAIAPDEFHTLFEETPAIEKLQVGDILNNTFRYIGTIRARLVFYIFERLDIYEQADLIKKQRKQTAEKKTEQKTETKATSTSAKEAEQPKPIKP